MIPTEFKSRINWFLVFAAVLTAAFSVFLIQWVRFCLEEDLFSYTLIVPGVCAWLIWQQKESLNFEFRSGSTVALSFLGMSLLLLGGSFWVGSTDLATAISFRTGAYASLLIAGSYFFLGRRLIQQILFPVMFLLFMVPFPPLVVEVIEIGLQNASAEVSGWFFSAIGLSHVQDGRVFLLPNITIEVAQECSGIRSTIVLFITGTIAAYLFLPKQWQRITFCALIIPLGIARNAFRIVTIGWLCTQYGPEMIDSPIHHRGGPVFFGLSLIPLFVLLWVFRRMNRPERSGGTGDEGGRVVEMSEPSKAVQ